MPTAQEKEEAQELPREQSKGMDIDQDEEEADPQKPCAGGSMRS